MFDYINIIKIILVMDKEQYKEISFLLRKCI